MGPSTLASPYAAGDADGMEGTRIVVGVDGSATSQEDLRWATGLGEALGAEVVAIHALGLLGRRHDPDASARSWRRTLCGLADDVDADLVVVGTRGRGGADELLLGSVARTVADRARRPTLVVPASAGPVHLHRTGADHRERGSASPRS